MNEEKTGPVPEEKDEELCVGGDGLAAPPEQAGASDGAEPAREDAGASLRPAGVSSEKSPPQSEPDYRAHLASLYEQGAALAREIPGFSIEEALRDRDFLRLTSPAVGVSVRRAWYALHGAEREQQAARRAAEQAASALARSAARPREGGRGLAGSLSAADPRALDRAGRAALRQRICDAAARGEKVYP